MNRLLFAVKKAFIFCLSLALAPDQSGHCADEPSVVSPSNLALELADSIEGDSDVKADKLLSVALTAASCGDIDAAEAAAALIDDTRRVIATAGLVKVLAGQGADREMLSKELASVKRFVTRGNALATDLARMELAVALAQISEEADSVGEWLSQIRDKETAAAGRLLLMVIEADKGGKFDQSEALDLVATVAQSGPFPASLTAAKELFEVAMNRHAEAGTKEEQETAVKLALDALELPAKANVDTTSLLFDAATKLFRAGAEMETIPLFEKAMVAMQRMPDGYELKAALHARWAELWVARGRKDDAMKIIEKGRKLAEEKLEPMHRPAVLAQLAMASKLAGDDRMSESLIDQAIRIAIENPNPRMRLLAGVDVCLAFAQFGGQLPEATLTRLRELGGSPPVSSGS